MQGHGLQAGQRKKSGNLEDHLGDQEDGGGGKSCQEFERPRVLKVTEEQRRGVPEDKAEVGAEGRPEFSGRCASDQIGKAEGDLVAEQTLAADDREARQEQNDPIVELNPTEQINRRQDLLI